MTAKVKKRPRPTASEGGSFYPTLDNDEEMERSTFGMDEEETGIDDDGCNMLPPNSKSRFSSSNSMDLDDSDKFQGNKGPSMPFPASQEEHAFMSSQVTSSQVAMNTQKALDPQKMSFGTYVHKSTSSSDKQNLEEYLDLDAASTIMPGSRSEGLPGQSKGRDSSSQDAIMSFDGAGDNPPRARRSAKFGSFDVQGEIDELTISDTEW